MRWIRGRASTMWGIWVASGLVGCDQSPVQPDPPADYGLELPSEWVTVVDNPLLPLQVGRTWSYRSETPDGVETVTIEVLAETRTVNGVVATVVRDRGYLDGELQEESTDWVAQDASGNVWFLGGEFRDFENGNPVDAGTVLEWGVDGALPGIMMWGQPSSHVGEEYRHDYLPGVAENWGKLIALDETVTVASGTFSGCAKVEEWDALEEGTLEEKFYCTGVGVVLTHTLSEGLRVELTEYQ